jgi:hypothetical protein
LPAISPKRLSTHNQWLASPERKNKKKKKRKREKGEGKDMKKSKEDCYCPLTNLYEQAHNL